MKIELLVDAQEFWTRLKEDLGAARKNAYVQTLSFEGDRVGTALARTLERCPAPDRKLLIDGYSLFYHSDRVIPGRAWLDRAFRREVMLTHRWIRRLRGKGTQVRFCNPIGPSPVNLVRRNHKKIALVDDRIVYLGGINFSDHNFAWHDMMFRVEDEDLARCVAADFRSSWAGRPQAADRIVGSLRLISLNGRSNERWAHPILVAIDSARSSIDVVSPYLSHPFTRYLAAAKGRGVRVRVLTPGRNNKPNLAGHILQTAHRHDFELFQSDGMSHLKAMLIDDELLIAGSSNFDFLSYHMLEELIVMSRDRAMVEEFVERVWAPDFAAALTVRFRPTLRTWWGHGAVRLAARIADFLAVP